MTAPPIKKMMSIILLTYLKQYTESLKENFFFDFDWIVEVDPTKHNQEKAKEDAQKQKVTALYNRFKYLVKICSGLSIF